MEGKGKIYKLYCSDGYYYYGSTHNKYLSQRYHKHKTDSVLPSYKDNKVYSHINKLGWSNVSIILVEEFDYTTRDEMRRRENAYIVAALDDALCLNHNRAYVTDEERLLKSKEYKATKRAPNKEMITCECGIEHTRGRTEQHRKSLKHRMALGL
jgi:hypothetical protein